MPRRLLIAVVTGGIALAGAAPATATRYAAPTGSASNLVCAATAPCTLQRALAVSTPGEEIIMAQGNYVVAAPAPDACTAPQTAAQSGNIAVLVSNRFVHGVLGRPRPRIIGTAATCVTLAVANTGEIRHVQLENYNTVKPETYALVVDAAGTAKDIVTAGASPRAQMRNGAHLYNSVLNSGIDGISLRSYFGSGPHNALGTSSYITNVTARGQVLAVSVQNSAVDIDCINSIASGGFRIEEHNAIDQPQQYSSMRLDHCIGATSSDGGFQEAFAFGSGNNPVGTLALAADGYHELPGSNSINNGIFVAGLNGTVDIDGGDRTVGANPDIGADESGAGLPTLDSGGVVARGFRTATILGSASANGLSAAVRVEYGPSTSYGLNVPALSVCCDFLAHSVSVKLTGLTANAVYHYRLVAGTVAGEDRSIVFADADHDGWFANADCNEANAKINPGAKEIVGNKVDENCDGVAAPYPVLASDVTIGFLFFKHYTKLTALNITKAKKGSKAKLICKGRGCPFKSRTKKIKKDKGKLSLKSLVKKGHYAKGTKLEVQITRPGYIGKDVTLTFRNGKAPKRKNRCLTPGKTKPVRC